MKRCSECKHEPLVSGRRDDTIRVGGRRFVTELPAMECPGCGEVYYALEDLTRFEMAVARALVTAGDDSHDAFRFMRKAIGLPAAELAGLLNVAPETVSRWENDRLPVERRALALVQALVVEHGSSSTPTLERLRALVSGPKRQPRTQRLAV